MQSDTVMALPRMSTPILINPTKATSLILCATALLAAGCGSKSPTDQIRDVYSQSTAALKSGDGKAFCDSLTPSSADSVVTTGKPVTGASDCAGAVTKMLNAAKALKTKDWKTFCASLSEDISQGIAIGSGKGTSGCAKAAAKLSQSPKAAAAFAAIGAQLDSQFSRMASGTADRIIIKGEHATATIKPAQPGDKPLKFTKTDSGWKIDSGS